MISPVSSPSSMYSPEQWRQLLQPLEVLKNCTQCPRQCNADRTGDKLGYCKSGLEFAIGSICAHRGEEPVIAGKHGICNIFFMHCNMQCVYCQNWQISRTHTSLETARLELSDVIARIESVLDQGPTSVGFVSPSHYIPQVRVIIEALKLRGRNPVFVFNTSSYDRVETIRSFEDSINVYLPDLKYMDNRLAKAYSDTPDYVENATAAIKEMYRQKGGNIYLNDDGSIQFGLIIRHLVIPGQMENSKAVLRFIAEELSPNVHVSLMSQFHPIPATEGHPRLGRTLYKEEYEQVLDEFDRLGFHRGWVQQLDSPLNYRPDFTFDHPFEH
ncbi:MAG: radical SAM protein [Candidatus Zixiibacteriota bacterium]